jgi:hypothetical protein
VRDRNRPLTAEPLAREIGGWSAGIFTFTMLSHRWLLRYHRQERGFQGKPLRVWGRSHRGYINCPMNRENTIALWRPCWKLSGLNCGILRLMILVFEMTAD